MSLKRIVAVGLLALPAISLAGEEIETLTNPTAYFHGLGYKVRGGLQPGASASRRPQGEGPATFPTFSSSFSVGGITYPFTMIGYPPSSGLSAYIKSVIIPLRMNFSSFGKNHDVSLTFDPAPAVTNIVNSPLYMPADYPEGFRGQFVDSMQRAAFWNQMDDNHSWHLQMERPRVLRPIDVEVTPETGKLTKDMDNNYSGDVKIDFLDAEAQTILQLLNLSGDTLPIFVTDNVTAEALGYHSAASITGSDGITRDATYIFTSWLDPVLVPALLADVSTFNHELAEWANDPFINNRVPTWKYPPDSDSRASCSHNPLLEVGDPQGNGYTYDDYPTIEVTLAGVTYHLQQLVLWQWFTDQTPSSAFGGWYTFPDPTSLIVPAVYCN